MKHLLTHDRNKTHAQHTELEAQKSAITQLNNKVDALRQEVSRLGHVEQGTVDCHGSDAWRDGWFAAGWNPSGGFHASKSVRVNFRKPYIIPPVVQLSIIAFYNAENKHEEYAAVVEDVDTLGFTVSCMTYDDGLFAVRDMDVAWISVPYN